MGANSSSQNKSGDSKVDKTGRVTVDRPKYGEFYDNNQSANMAHTVPPETMEKVLAQLEYDPEDLTADHLKLPNNTDQKKYCVTVDGVLSPAECKMMIELTESFGYEPALINTGVGQQYLPDIRNNDRVMIDSKEIAAVLFKRIRHLLPPEYDGTKVKELNERLRFLRYDSGMEFKTHMDGTYVRTSEPRDTSWCSLIIYLNDDFTGGVTEFPGFSGEQHGHCTTNPMLPGKALIFKHNILHKGCAIETGRKYILRTDVMYDADPQKQRPKRAKKPRKAKNLEAKRAKKPRIDRSKISGLLSGALSQRKPRLGVMGKEGETFEIKPKYGGQAVEIMFCNNCKISISKKCKQVTMGSCKGVELDFKGVIASCSVYECENITLKSSGCSSYEIEKTENASVSIGADQTEKVVFILTNSKGIKTDKRDADDKTTDSCQFSYNGVLTAAWDPVSGFSGSQLRRGEDPLMGLARANTQADRQAQTEQAKTPPPKDPNKPRKSVTFDPDTIDNSAKNSAKTLKRVTDLGDEKTDPGASSAAVASNEAAPSETPAHISGLWMGQAVPDAEFAREVPANPIKWSLSLIKNQPYPSAFGAGYFDDAADVQDSPIIFYSLQGKWDPTTNAVTMKKMYDGAAAALGYSVDYVGTLSWIDGTYVIQGTWDNPSGGTKGAFAARLEL